MTLFTLVKEHFPKASSPHTPKKTDSSALKGTLSGWKHFPSKKTPRPKHLSLPRQKTEPESSRLSSCRQTPNIDSDSDTKFSIWNKKNLLQYYWKCQNMSPGCPARNEAFHSAPVDPTYQETPWVPWGITVFHIKYLSDCWTVAETPFRHLRIQELHRTIFWMRQFNKHANVTVVGHGEKVPYTTNVSSTVHLALRAFPSPSSVTI